MSRLFVAVWPPDHVVDSLLGLHRKDEREARFIAPENWHVTMRFLGEAEPDAVCEALDRADFLTTVARMGPAVDVIHERVLVAPIAGVDELAATVASATRDVCSEEALEAIHRPHHAGPASTQCSKHAACTRRVGLR